MEKNDKRIVLTFGVFDLMHLGHVRLFERARRLGDELTVAVQKDEFILKYKPEAQIVYSLDERKEMVQSCRYVDRVVEYSDVADDIKNIHFDILVTGPDQCHTGFQEAIQWCKDNGRTVIQLPRTEGISSSLLRNGTNSK